MSQEGKFEYESIQDIESIRKFFQSLNEGFEKGKICLDSDGNEIELIPENLINFKIKAKSKGKKSKIEIKISWKEAEKAKSSEPLQVRS